MPKETIATTAVANGDHPTSVERWTNLLQVTWGARGGCPEAPDGWVNAGYAIISIVKSGTTDADDAPITYAVDIDPDEIDHLIRTLKRVRRQAFRGEVKPGGNGPHLHAELDA